ncbi:hypothetical protein LJR045_000171 [Microbacterium sp. LjRoot45]|uniref:hypothetical protein n=1 Tax=Microbacterium sp. LjRoot45 TaxID=3342329 RepID=UPI003ECE385F
MTVATAAALGVVAVIVAVLVLTRPGTPAAVESETPSPTPTHIATPTPTPTSPPPARTPVTVADGSCDQVIAADDLPAAIGAGTLQDVTRTSVHTLGGLSCRWSGTWYVAVDLFPASVVPGSFTDRYADEQCESIGYDGYGCRTARATDEVWALVTVLPGETTYGDDIPRGLVDEVADVIAARLPVLAPGAAAERAGWAGFTDCDDVRSAIDLASALGDTPVEGGTGTDGSSPDPVHEIASEAGSVIGTCVWSTATDETTTRFPALWVTVYPGGADGWERLVEGDASTAVDTTVAGAETALIIDRGGEADQTGTGDPLTRLWVTDGDSIVVLESRELDRDVRDVAAELLAAR